MLIRHVGELSREWEDRAWHDLIRIMGTRDIKGLSLNLPPLQPSLDKHVGTVALLSPVQTLQFQKDLVDSQVRTFGASSVSSLSIRCYLLK